MTCKLTISLLSESQQGNIGDDWKYQIDIKVFNQGLAGHGTIDVAKHNLASGTTQAPPNGTESVIIDACEAGNELLVRLTLNATEVDFLKSDRGETQLNMHMPSPSPGAAPISREIELSVGVRESPGLMDETAILSLQLKLVASAD